MSQRLVIHRSEWLRGEGSDNSRLFRHADHKLCCVGIYLRDLLRLDPHDDLDEVCTAAEVHENFATAGSSPIPGWMLSAISGADIGKLYDINDDMHRTDADREQAIAELFGYHDVHVTFQD